MDANLCFMLCNIDTNYEQGAIAARDHIEQTSCNYAHQLASWEKAAPSDLHVNSVAMLEWLMASSQSDVEHIELDSEESKFILCQYSPIALLEGSALQNIAHAGNNHELTATKGHLIHSWYVGGGRYTDNQSVLYRQLLQKYSIYLPSVCSESFADALGINPKAWALPAWWLSLSLFPEEYKAEILGATLFSLTVLAPMLVQSAKEARASAWFQARNSSKREAMQAAAKSAIAHILAEDNDRIIFFRIVKGFLISRLLLDAWQSEVTAQLDRGHLSPQAAMVRLVKQKAKYAAGYHSRLKLGPDPFDSLITHDAASFVKMLGQSRWVSPGQPDKSLLLTRLIAFGGPMFRIFNDEELFIIRTWIESLSISDPPFEQRTSPANADTVTPNAVPAQAHPAIKTASKMASIDIRDLYHQLLNIERYPHVRSTACAFATKWLARSALSLERSADALPFKEYSLWQLREWFERKAIAQAQSYAANSNQSAKCHDHGSKTRDEVIEEALQLCPMIFIDGAWLQRWTSAGLVDSQIGALLYKIYSDEIGNGELELNHPNIYRALMRQMNISLPDFRNIDFAYFPRFNKESFLVPVFWLSLSQFPRRFLPETLGLNLAMELSGVGGAYRTARDELRQHGFSTLFVDLHNTIDNVSSGHSAMALTTIEWYLDEIRHVHGSQLVDEQWRRVWNGFRSLSPPRRHWKEIFTPLRYAY